MSIQQGLQAEERVCQYLLNQGYDLIERNYRCRCGEIDLILKRGKALVFAEVRQRRSAEFGGAAASVTWRKQQKLQRTAAHFLQSHPQYRLYDCRFDVIALEGTESRVHWIKNAFGQ